MATTVTATYVDASAKVTVAVAGATGYAVGTYVTFQRSLDGVTWTTLRGGANVALSGGICSIDDYEFTDGVTNTYRALFVYPGVPGFQGQAAITAVTAAGASVNATPTVWPTTAVGSLVLAFVACTNSNATLNTPAGWTRVATLNTLAGKANVGVYELLWTAASTLPTFTASSTVAGDILTVKLESYFNAQPTLATSTSQLNAAVQNIAYPALVSPTVGYSDGVLWAYKTSTNTGVTPAPSVNDTATGWSSIIFNDLNGSLVAGTLTLTGGGAAVSVAWAAFFQQATSIDSVTAIVTPALTQCWIKNPIRPYLNRAAVTIELADETHDARSGVFPVINRTLPVAVTDLMGGRNSTLTVRLLTETALRDLKDCLLVGEVLFLQSPAGAVSPTGYFVAGQLNRHRVAATARTRYLSIPITEVAAPDASLAALIGTWTTVVSGYATWSTLTSAKAAWSDVLNIVGTAADVITT